LKTYLAVIGVILCTLGIGLVCSRVYTFFAGVSVTGTVIDHETTTIDDSIAYLPTIKFIDKEGYEHTFTSRAGGAAPKPNVGDLVPVKYLPSNPKIAYINSFLHLWAGPIACIFLGLCALYAVWQMQH
jgi:hypothetical protein